MDRKASVISNCPPNRRKSLRGRQEFLVRCGGALLTNEEYRATIDGSDHLQIVIRACAFIACLIGFSSDQWNMFWTVDTMCITELYDKGENGFWHSVTKSYSVQHVSCRVAAVHILRIFPLYCLPYIKTLSSSETHNWSDDLFAEITYFTISWNPSCPCA